MVVDVADQEGWNVIWVHGTLAENWDRFSSGQIDLMAGVVEIPEREKLYDFNHEPALSVWSQIYALPGSGINTILDLNGKRVALVKGDFNGIAFRDYARKFNVNVTYVEKVPWTKCMVRPQQEMQMLSSHLAWEVRNFPTIMVSP